MRDISRGCTISVLPARYPHDREGADVGDDDAAGEMLPRPSPILAGQLRQAPLRVVEISIGQEER